MSDKEITEFSEKLQQGLDMAERKMLEEKALHDQDIIVCADDGSIQRIPAKEAMSSLSE
ncbi:MAG: ribosome recycling factor [Bacteroidales bacterium]|jgi:hypothetical protein|nr:ribosome recycling factor [Bacteroidales bacterium]